MKRDCFLDKGGVHNIFENFPSNLLCPEQTPFNIVWSPCTRGKAKQGILGINVKWVDGVPDSINKLCDTLPYLELFQLCTFLVWTPPHLLYQHVGEWLLHISCMPCHIPSVACLNISAEYGYSSKSTCWLSAQWWDQQDFCLVAHQPYRPTHVVNPPFVPRWVSAPDWAWFKMRIVIKIDR